MFSVIVVAGTTAPLVSTTKRAINPRVTCTAVSTTAKAISTHAATAQTPWHYSAAHTMVAAPWLKDIDNRRLSLTSCFLKVIDSQHVISYVGKNLTVPLCAPNSMTIRE